MLYFNIKFNASSHCSPRIALANCEQWYIIFCLLLTFLINRVFFFSHVRSNVYRRISVNYGWQISRASWPYLDSVTICWIIIWSTRRFGEGFPLTQMTSSHMFDSTAAHFRVDLIHFIKARLGEQVPYIWNDFNLGVWRNRPGCSKAD